MKKIPLTQNMFALVDDEDFEWLNKEKWQFRRQYASKTKYLGGGRKNPIRKLLTLHRELLKHYNVDIENMEIDHIDGNKLNNQKNNLRVCSHQNNSFNQKIAVNNTSGYKGVTWNKKNKKWGVRISYKWDKIFLGYFDDKHYGAKIYNEKAKELHGEFARINNIKQVV